MAQRLGLSSNGREKEHTSEKKGKKREAQMPLCEARPEGFYTRVEGKIKTSNLRLHEGGKSGRTKMRRRPCDDGTDAAPEMRKHLLNRSQVLDDVGAWTTRANKVRCPKW